MPDTEQFPTFAELLRHYMWRERTPPISANKLAKELGVSRQTVANWMNGSNRPNEEMLRVLAEKLDRPIGELYRAAGYPVVEVEVEATANWDELLANLVAGLQPAEREQVERLLSMSPDERRRILERMDALIDRARRDETDEPVPKALAGAG